MDTPKRWALSSPPRHGFARPVNNMVMYAASEKFLAQQIGGRYQESMSPAVAQRLKETTVDAKTVVLAGKTPLALIK